MWKKGFVLAILVLAFAVYVTVNSALAHTPSPPICNDPICNIDIGDNFFSPSNITIRPPNPVTLESVKIIWVNHGSNVHTVTSGPRDSPNPVFNSGFLSPGETFELTINQTIYDQLIAQYGSSSIPYYCSLHGTMNATLNITGEPIPEYSILTIMLILALITLTLAMLFRIRKARTMSLENY